MKQIPASLAELYEAQNKRLARRKWRNRAIGAIVLLSFWVLVALSFRNMFMQ